MRGKHHRPPLVMPSAVVILSGFVMLSGCGYPTVDGAAYQSVKALDAVCQQQDAAQLPAARQLIRQQAEAGDISHQEQELLEAIVDQAAQGQWDSALQQTRGILKAQVDW